MKMVDIDHYIHIYHNRIDLLNNLMDKFSYIDPSMDMIDIRISDNHSNPFDSQDDNSENIRMRSNKEILMLKICS
jgi:hypothetical protein